MSLTLYDEKMHGVPGRSTKGIGKLLGRFYRRLEIVQHKYNKYLKFRCSCKAFEQKKNSQV